MDSVVFFLFKDIRKISKTLQVHVLKVIHKWGVHPLAQAGEYLAPVTAIGPQCAAAAVGKLLSFEDSSAVVRAPVPVNSAC